MPRGRFTQGGGGKVAAPLSPSKSTGKPIAAKQNGATKHKCNLNNISVRWLPLHINVMGTSNAPPPPPEGRQKKRETEKKKRKEGGGKRLGEVRKKAPTPQKKKMGGKGKELVLLSERGGQRQLFRLSSSSRYHCAAMIRPELRELRIVNVGLDNFIPPARFASERLLPLLPSLAVVNDVKQISEVLGDVSVG